jgi:hypothetical protein
MATICAVPLSMRNATGAAAGTSTEWDIRLFRAACRMGLEGGLGFEASRPPIEAGGSRH